MAAVERQVAAVERYRADRRCNYMPADVEEFLRAGDTIGVACVEPTCPDYGDPDLGEGCCPAEHAGPVLERQERQG
jgi:hypothetical protein